MGDHRVGLGCEDIGIDINGTGDKHMGHRVTPSFGEMVKWVPSRWLILTWTIIADKDNPGGLENQGNKNGRVPLFVSQAAW